MKKGLTICIWFDDQAKEAANFYVSTFPNSKIKKTVLYPKAAEKIAGKPAGSVMTVEFEVNGADFLALNGGKVPGFDLTSAISFIVKCDTQEEIDDLWKKLSAVPEMEQCGWLKDKFGVTWQITPTILDEYLSDSDQEKVERVTAAFMPMKKLDIAKLKEAYEGK
ncbi:MAG TPA: VOC family protein [Candidatus Saccharimonadales bacterium]|nr:VOC family protein [Candidatus Saccharimonadales bacterium]